MNLTLGLNLAQPRSGGAAGSSLLTGLDAYWKLDEASGSRADSHGGQTLTQNGGVTQAAGKVGSAAAFANASSQYLARASEAALLFGNKDWTLAGWLYSSDGGPDFRTLFSKWDQGSPSGNAVFCYLYSGALTFGQSLTGNPDVLATVNAPTAITVNTWFHVLCQYDATADLLGISVNNAALTTAPCASAVAGTHAFELGRWGAFLGRYFDGRLDEWGKWSRLLTPAEKTKLAAGTDTYPFTLPGLVVARGETEVPGGAGELTGPHVKEPVG